MNNISDHVWQDEHWCGAGVPGWLFTLACFAASLANFSFFFSSFLIWFLVFGWSACGSCALSAMLDAKQDKCWTGCLDTAIFKYSAELLWLIFACRRTVFLTIDKSKKTLSHCETVDERHVSMTPNEFTPLAKVLSANTDKHTDIPKIHTKCKRSTSIHGQWLWHDLTNVALTWT